MSVNITIADLLGIGPVGSLPMLCTVGMYSDGVGDGKREHNDSTG